MQNTQRPAGRRPRPLPLLLALPVLGWLLAGSASAALIGGGYLLNWDQNVTKTDTGTTDSRILKQTAELIYKGFYNPALANEFAIRFEQEINNDAPDITRLLPSVVLQFRGTYWQGGVGVKETIENSDEPEKGQRRSNSNYVELLYTPKKWIPDFKGRYALDTDFQGGTTDTEKQGVTLSSFYEPNDWLAAKGEYNWNQFTDNLKEDQDTEDDKITGTIALRKAINRKIRFATEFRAEQIRSKTLVSAGGTRDVKEDRSYQWRNALQFKPFRDTTLDGGYDWTQQENKRTNTQTNVTTSRAGFTQTLLAPVEIKGDFTRTVTENRNTLNRDDFQTAEDTWNLGVNAKFSKQADFQLKYQDKKTVETHTRDKTLDKSTGTTVYGASWLGEFSTWWRASVSYERTDTFDNDILSKKESKYSLKSAFDFPAIRFALEPIYDITLTDTYLPLPGKKEDSGDLRVRLAWFVFQTRNLEVKFDHTYGRLEKQTSDPTDIIEPQKTVITRTDATQANLVWLNPIPGWKFGFDVTRSATDTSGDDLPPDITVTFGPRVELVSGPLALGTIYKYDWKKTGDESETFEVKAGWLAPRWDTTLSYTFKKTFSAALNEGYSISLTFRYNL